MKAAIISADTGAESARSINTTTVAELRQALDISASITKRAASMLRPCRF